MDMRGDDRRGAEEMLEMQEVAKISVEDCKGGGEKVFLAGTTYQAIERVVKVFNRKAHVWIARCSRACADAVADAVEVHTGVDRRRIHTFGHRRHVRPAS
eukprot:362548-Chlamydomonas_euryale.AAC.7